MGSVQTNRVAQSVCEETSPGTASTTGYQLLPNSIGAFGGTTRTVSRSPISPNRQREAGTIVDRDSAVTLEMDATMDHIERFIEGAVNRSLTGPKRLAVSAIVAGGVTVASDGDFVLGTLVRLRGLQNAGNNGLFKVQTGSDATNIVLGIKATLDLGGVGSGDLDTIVRAKSPGTAGNSITVAAVGDSGGGVTITEVGNAVTIHYESGVSDVAAVESAIGSQSSLIEVATAGTGATVLTAPGDNFSATNLAGGLGVALTAEVPAATRDACVEECGFEFTTGDLEVNSDGNLITTTKNLTQLPIVAGQRVHVGDEGSAYQFATLANHGFARIVSVAANLMVLDRTFSSFTTDDGSGKTVRLFYGRKTHVAPTTDGSAVDKTYQVELKYPTLGSGNTARYEYAKGNVIDEMTIVIPQTDKATMTVSMVGTQTADITDTQQTFGSTAKQQNKRIALNTTSDIGRLQVFTSDETGLTTYMKSATLRIRNNVVANKAIGVLGAIEITKGNCEVDVDWQGYFTNEDVVNAANNNDPVGMVLTMRNGDGAVVFDVPEGRLGQTSRDFPLNELVQVNSTTAANRDDTYNSSLVVSLFPYCPPVRTA